MNDKNRTDPLDPLHIRRKVASLSLFYRYYLGHCSCELKDRAPQALPRPRCTCQAVASHRYCVEFSKPRIARYSNCFFPATPSLGNSLPT